MSERPRLNLKPRSADAPKAGGYGASSGKSNPFGAARPREAVIAERSGVSEEDVIKKQAEQFKVRRGARAAGDAGGGAGQQGARRGGRQAAPGAAPSARSLLFCSQKRKAWPAAARPGLRDRGAGGGGEGGAKAGGGAPGGRRARHAGCARLRLLASVRRPARAAGAAGTSPLLTRTLAARSQGKLNLSRKQREEKEVIEDKIENAKEVLKAEGA